MTFIDHPRVAGVVISALDPEGACVAQGCTVGDHILKINGVKPNGHVEAMHQVDSVWSTKASDPTKDFLKLSLAERTQTLTLAKPGQVAVRVVSDTPGVGPLPTDISRPAADQIGLTLTDHQLGGLGVIVEAVVPGLAAEACGLAVGHVIYSAGGVLTMKHAEVLKFIQEEFYKMGWLTLVASTKRMSEAEVKKQKQHLEQIPVKIAMVS